MQCLAGIQLSLLLQALLQHGLRSCHCPSLTRSAHNKCSWSHLFFFLQVLLQRSQLSCHCLSLALQPSELLLGCGLALQQVCTEQVGLGQPAAQLVRKPQALLLCSLQLLRCSCHLLPEQLGLLLVSCLVGSSRVPCSCNLQS